MKYRLLKFILLLAISFGVKIQINAQTCGQYITTLNIITDEGKPLENAAVRLMPFEKDEIRNRLFIRDEVDSSKFHITFKDQELIRGIYRIVISANDFIAYKGNIRFPYCQQQNFTIYLRADWRENTSILTGVIYDPKGLVIENAKITAVNKAGKKFETLTDLDGRYVFSLPFNSNKTKSNLFFPEKYNLTIEKSGFKKSSIKEFVFVPSQFSSMQLDVALEAEQND